MSQPRVITLHSYTVVIYLGPVQFLGQWMSFMSYIGILHLSLNSFISLMLSMVYRYYSIKYYRFSVNTSITVCCCGYIIPFIIFASCSTIRVDGSYETNKELLGDMVTNLKDYGMVLSTDVRSQPQVVILILFVTVGLIPIYVVMYWCRYEIYKKLRMTSSVHSVTTKDNARRLVKALTIQSIIPLISVFPASVFFCLSISRIVEPLLYSYLIVPCLTIGCIADPLVTIHSVLPYRRYVLRMCNLQSGEMTTSNQDRSKSENYQTIGITGKKVFLATKR